MHPHRSRASARAPCRSSTRTTPTCPDPSTPSVAIGADDESSPRVAPAADAAPEIPCARHAAPPGHRDCRTLTAAGAILTALTHLPGRWCHHLSLRRRAPPPFDSRDDRLVRLLQFELASRIGPELALPTLTPALDRPVILPPRLRQVRAALMCGDSEKEVAAKLGLSPHTVHFHVHRLHTLFHVESRGQLLAVAFTQPPISHAPGATGEETPWQGGR